MSEAFFNENPRMTAELKKGNPLGRIGETRDLRGVTVWLASDASSYCTGSE